VLAGFVPSRTACVVLPSKVRLGSVIRSPMEGCAAASAILLALRQDLAVLLVDLDVVPEGRHLPGLVPGRVERDDEAPVGGALGGAALDLDLGGGQDGVERLLIWDPDGDLRDIDHGLLLLRARKFEPRSADGSYGTAV
jgi:hypothetical protein